MRHETHTCDICGEEVSKLPSDWVTASAYRGEIWHSLENGKVFIEVCPKAECRTAGIEKIKSIITPLL